MASEDEVNIARYSNNNNVSYLQFSSFLETEYNLTTLAANKEKHITVA